MKKNIKEHHGGSWKVAYADFVTAMMTFFLVMWLVNISPEEKDRRVNDFPSSYPFNLDIKNGAIGVMTGIGAMNTKEGEDTFPSGKPHQTRGKYEKKEGGDQHDTEKIAKGMHFRTNNKQKIPVTGILRNIKRYEATYPGSFLLKEKMLGGREPYEEIGGASKKAKYPNIKEWSANAKQSVNHFAESDENEEEGVQKKNMIKVLSEHVQSNLPKWLWNHVKIEEIGHRIRITLWDHAQSSMFETGQRAIKREVRSILSLLAENLKDVHYKIQIEGHADGNSYNAQGPYTNLNLSIDRANECKNCLQENGVAENKFNAITGKGASCPLDKKNPLAPQNRRIEIFLTPESL